VENIDLLIVDECHKCKAGSKLAKMLRRIKTPNRFGFTGTFPEKKYVDIWKIIGTFGPLLYEKASKELRDDNTLTDVEPPCCAIKRFLFIISDIIYKLNHVCI
jgi:superfamily II DNA or RNA helicase